MGENTAAMKVLLRYTGDEFADKEFEQHDTSSWRVTPPAVRVQ